MIGGERTDPLAHLHLLGQPLIYEPFAGTDLLRRLGGQATVDRLVDLLYDGFEADPVRITRALAGRWLHHFEYALRQTVANETDRNAIFEHASTLALALVNEADAPAVPAAVVRRGPPLRRALAS